MGIIRQQSVKSTILTYIGFTIGAINMVFVMPHFFSKEQYGLITVFVSFATQVVTVGSMGMAIVINKFLPYYKAHLPAKKRDLTTLVLLVGTLGMILVLGFSFLNHELIIRKFSEKSPLFVEYLYLFPVFSMGYFYYYVFESFSNNYKFTVWSSFVREIFYRFFNLAAALLFALGWLSFKGVMEIYMLIYWMGAFLLFLNLYYHKELYIPFKVSSLTKRIKRNIAKYSLSSWGMSVLGATFQFIDTFAIAGLIGLGPAAIYSLAKLLISPIIIPTSSVVAISIPLISDAWRRNDVAKIEEIYKKTAVVLFLVCGFAFFLVWVNVNEILGLVPSKFFGSSEAFSDARTVILILGLARAIDFVTSVNTPILQTSRKYYWADFYCTIVYVVISIPLNYILIKNYGIIGAALSYFVLSFLSNVYKSVYLYIKEKMHPFSAKWGSLPFIFGLLYLIAIALNLVLFGEHPTDSFVLSITIVILRSLILTALFIWAIFKLKISEDINSIITNIAHRLKTFIHDR